LLNPFVDIRKTIHSFLSIPSFAWDYFQYRKSGGIVRLRDMFPILNEKTTTTEIDKHYFYQDLWAFKKILKSKVKRHVDIGSNHKYIGFLSTITEVEFVDIRPLDIKIDNLLNKKGSILELPFGDSTIKSLSCLHVAEHIGLGRYGDPIDPEGTIKACKELVRILKPGGNLYLGIPVGRPRTCFNAHRIHNSSQIIEYFAGLKLVSFSGIDDYGIYFENIPCNAFDTNEYACGLFHFTKV
jgi:SAM-dependent methyltransferase